MKRLMSGLTSAESEAFNDRVADEMERLGGLIVKRRVKKAGPPGGRFDPPGDIDVLVVNRKNRTLFLVECKELALARTPREMANELDTLFRGGEKRKSTVEKHLSRKRWAQSNLSALLEWLGVGWSKKWKVDALIVLDYRPMSAYLTTCQLPVLGLRELPQYVGS